MRNSVFALWIAIAVLLLVLANNTDSKPAIKHNHEYVLMLETQLQKAVALVPLIRDRIDHVITIGTNAGDQLEATKQELNECHMMLGGQK